ncbi:MAG: AI-2E family transporter [Thermoleophilia bacterium]|jgi:predicted PurR-regulated permease PerM|nr:AI-2E family transporter [Thermoleophilia bacterium]
MTDETDRGETPRGASRAAGDASNAGVGGDSPPAGLGRAALVSLRFLIIVAAVVVLGLVLQRLQIVILPVTLAILGTVPLLPVRRRLERAGLPRRAATALVFVAALAVLAGVIALVAPRLVSEFGSLDTAVADGIREVRDWLVDGPLSLSPASVDQVADHLVDLAEANVGLLATGATTAVAVVTGAFVTLVLGAFFLSGGDHMWTWSVRMLPSRYREATDAAGRRAWHVLSGYLAGSAINGAIEATVIGIALVIIGVPLVAPLMALTFVAPFFPVVGAIVAGAIAVLVALVSEGWVAALALAIVYLAVQQLESNLLAPFILGRAVRLHPVVVLVALLAGASLGGVVGAFVALPVAAVAWGVVQELVERGMIASPSDMDALLHGQAAKGIKEGRLEENDGG